ncbi:MAG: hypothetical protein JSV08_02820 [Acidobacteriota bacterium]|nr:MAG: hypothetical protein JSV08_02820 [Acidobacteriota bacterium]
MLIEEDSEAYHVFYLESAVDELLPGAKISEPAIYTSYAHIPVDKETMSTRGDWCGKLDVAWEEVKLPQAEIEKIHAACEKFCRTELGEEVFWENYIQFVNYGILVVEELKFNTDVYEVLYHRNPKLEGEACIGSGCGFHIYLKKDTLEVVAVQRSMPAMVLSR